MAYLISRPTRREAEAQRQESLSKLRLDPRRYRGTARSAEEAHDTQRKLEREGETFDRLWAVSDDSEDAKRANESLKLRSGINPETNEPLRR